MYSIFCVTSGHFIVFFPILTECKIQMIKKKQLFVHLMHLKQAVNISCNTTVIFCIFIKHDYEKDCYPNIIYKV